jgi:hypothetical protein
MLGLRPGGGRQYVKKRGGLRAAFLFFASGGRLLKSRINGLVDERVLQLILRHHEI